MLLSGTDGSKKRGFWVLKQEINVSMLYLINWALFNLCMESQSNGFQTKGCLLHHYYMIVGFLLLFFKLKTVALIICLYFGHWA